MLRISWTEKKPNVNVLREGNVQRSLLKTIRKRQMEFWGHVCRRRGLEFLSLTGKVEGKRDRGKQRITFLDSLCNSATGGQSKGLIFLKLSDDRDVWRGMVANVCSRSGTWWWWYIQKNGFPEKNVGLANAVWFAICKSTITQAAWNTTVPAILRKHKLLVYFDTICILVTINQPQV